MRTLEEIFIPVSWICHLEIVRLLRFYLISKLFSKNTKGKKRKIVKKMTCTFDYKNFKEALSEKRDILTKV